MSRAIIAIAMGAAVSGSALAAQDNHPSATFHDEAPIHWEDDAWTVFSYPGEEMCEASATLQSDERFTLAYFPKLKAFSFLGTNKNATSLEEGGNVELNLVFLKSGKADLGWGRRKFEISKQRDTVIFSSPLLPSPIDKDFAQSDSMGLFVTSSSGNPILVFGINLSGSSEALVHLRNCAFLAAKLNPQDPFLK